MIFLPWRKRNILLKLTSYAILLVSTLLMYRFTTFTLIRIAPLSRFISFNRINPLIFLGRFLLRNIWMFKWPFISLDGLLTIFLNILIRKRHLYVIIIQMNQISNITIDQQLYNYLYQVRIFLIAKVVILAGRYYKFRPSFRSIRILPYSWSCDSSSYTWYKA